MEQNEIVAELLHRLCAHPPQPGHPFTTLKSLCNEWADTLETAYPRHIDRLDPVKPFRAG